jgi:hypothetical protein
MTMSREPIFLDYGDGGDKVAAATLGAELLRRGITAHSIESALNLYREPLKQIERIAQPTEHWGQ